MRYVADLLKKMPKIGDAAYFPKYGLEGRVTAVQEFNAADVVEIEIEWPSGNRERYSYWTDLQFEDVQ